MTTGNQYKLLISFAIPIFIGNVFQQLYSMIDTIIVGRFVGVEALAAVGATGGFSFMLIGFSIGLAQGFSVLISQRFGAKDPEGIKKAYTQSIICAFVITTLISIVFYFLAKPMLRLVRTPDNIIDMATDYISIIYLFLNSAVFYNLFSSVLRALGDSKSPVLFLLLSSVLNILLDLFFVIVIPLAAKGVAIATVIAQFISAIVSYIYIYAKYPVFRASASYWRIDKAICKRLLAIGIPGAIQFSVCAIGVIVVQAFLNGFGSDAIAAYSVGCKIENIVTQFFPALGIAISTFAGQNFGAGKIKRIRNGFKSATIIMILYAIIASIAVRFISEPLSYLFVDKNSANPNVINMAVQYTTIASYFFIPLGLIFIFRTGSQGLGSGSIPMLSSILELSLRVIAAMILPGLIGYLGICLASPAAWIGAGFVLPFVCSKFIKKIELNLN